jgi:hypothetical protein
MNNGQRGADLREICAGLRAGTHGPQITQITQITGRVIWEKRGLAGYMRVIGQTGDGPRSRISQGSKRMKTYLTYSTLRLNIPRVQRRGLAGEYGRLAERAARNLCRHLWRNLRTILNSLIGAICGPFELPLDIICANRIK